MGANWLAASARSRNAVMDFYKVFPKVLPPLPRSRCGLRGGLHCGERAGVRGHERVMSPPHPNPIPHNTHPPKVTSLAGERGPETCWPPCEYDP